MALQKARQVRAREGDQKLVVHHQHNVSLSLPDDGLILCNSRHLQSSPLHSSPCHYFLTSPDAQRFYFYDLRPEEEEEGDKICGFERTEDGAVRGADDECDRCHIVCTNMTVTSPMVNWSPGHLFPAI